MNELEEPTPSIKVSKDVSDEQKSIWKSNSDSSFEQGGSFGNVASKPVIRFVKEIGCPSVSKVNNTENSRKPTVKYTEMYRNTSQSPRGIPQDNIYDKGYWDSGCSRHMTGNISYLSEYEPFNDGICVFWDMEEGKITGKGTIKTGLISWQCKKKCRSIVATSTMRQNFSSCKWCGTSALDTKLVAGARGLRNVMKRALYDEHQ
ncbi:hypothetical protein Tco_0921436 [Tanacetum coccineum]